MSLLVLSVLSVYAIDTKNIKPTINIPVVDLNVIEMPIEELNDIKTNNIIFTYYISGPISFDIIRRINMDTYLYLNNTVDTIINVSDNWDIFYNIKIKPMYEFYSTKIDLLGENGEYYPDGMTYYGWRWIELQQKEKDEGFTESVRQEWIKLFKEMKPYF